MRCAVFQTNFPAPPARTENRAAVLSRISTFRNLSLENSPTFQRQEDLLCIQHLKKSGKSLHPAITGASPETLTRLTDGTLYTFPLTGTRPRGNDKEEDEALERELLADEKELAEHNMLVDLGRNDLGRVSRLGSVQVETYASVVRFSHVMHIGSTVRGEIHPDRDAVDAIDSILPAGTLSGAPKVRACEIIAELEGRKRGIYGGAIGYLDFTGNMDTCIAIRLAYKKHDRICGQYGKDCAPAICSGICKVNERRHPGVSNDYLPINFVSKAVQKNVFS